jgi:putative transposase
MKKFKNKYRIPSARLQNWDYGSNGAYFITICTQNREHFFGKIVKSIVKSELNALLDESELGKIAEKIWLEIPIHFPYAELGNFIIMPNHIHGIVIINKNANNVEAQFIASVNIETQLNHSVNIDTQSVDLKLIDDKKTGGFAGKKNPLLNENVSRIIRWYKGRCSFEMRKIHADFGWQPRFYDHVIRDSRSFETIQNYIVNNPFTWKEDKFNNDHTA